MTKKAATIRPIKIFIQGPAGRVTNPIHGPIIIPSTMLHPNPNPPPSSSSSSSSDIVKTTTATIVTPQSQPSPPPKSKRTTNNNRKRKRRTGYLLFHEECMGSMRRRGETLKPYSPGIYGKVISKAWKVRYVRTYLYIYLETVKREVTLFFTFRLLLFLPLNRELFS